MTRSKVKFVPSLTLLSSRIVPSLFGNGNQGEIVFAFVGLGRTLDHWERVREKEREREGENEKENEKGINNNNFNTVVHSTTITKI